jgi:molybdate transport system permease protein
MGETPSSIAPMVLFTLGMCLLSTILIIPAGIGFGWLFARRNFPGKSLLDTALSLPLVLPPVATGLVLLRLLGRHAPLGGFLERVLHLEIVFTWKGVVIAAAVMSFPLLYRSARAAFEAVPTRLEEIARTLGAGNGRVFRTITLPLAARGLSGGMVLAFARALGEFGATIIVAGNIPGRTSTLSLSIYQAIQTGDERVAWTLLATSALLAFGALWLSERLIRQRSPGA